MKVKLWPSGHSEDYTLIAICRDEKQALALKKSLLSLKKALEKHPEKFDADWGPEDLDISLVGKKVMAKVYTAGYTEPIDKVVTKLKIKNAKYATNYQELEISISLPEKAHGDPRLALLLFDRSEENGFKWLQKRARLEKRASDLVFVYSGDGIYDADDGILYLDDQFDLNDHQNWRVEEIG